MNVTWQQRLEEEQQKSLQALEEEKAKQVCGRRFDVKNRWWKLPPLTIEQHRRSHQLMNSFQPKIYGRMEEKDTIAFQKLSSFSEHGFIEIDDKLIFYQVFPPKCDDYLIV